jgi:hypothetical protein
MQLKRKIPKAAEIKEEVESSCLPAEMLPVVATLLPKMLPL